MDWLQAVDELGRDDVESFAMTAYAFLHKFSQEAFFSEAVSPKLEQLFLSSDSQKVLASTIHTDSQEFILLKKHLKSISRNRVSCVLQEPKGDDSVGNTERGEIPYEPSDLYLEYIVINDNPEKFIDLQKQFQLADFGLKFDIHNIKREIEIPGYYNKSISEVDDIFFNFSLDFVHFFETKKFAKFLQRIVSFFGFSGEEIVGDARTKFPTLSNFLDQIFILDRIQIRSDLVGVIEQNEIFQYDLTIQVLLRYLTDLRIYYYTSTMK